MPGQSWGRAMRSYKHSPRVSTLTLQRCGTMLNAAPLSGAD